jgi:hypothetical protein
MAAMVSNWLKNWKSLKIFFRTMGWIETNFSQNAGTAHPLECKKLTDDRRQTQSDGKSSFKPSALVN